MLVQSAISRYFCLLSLWKSVCTCVEITSFCCMYYNIRSGDGYAAPKTHRASDYCNGSALIVFSPQCVVTSRNIRTQRTDRERERACVIGAVVRAGVHWAVSCFWWRGLSAQSVWCVCGNPLINGSAGCMRLDTLRYVYVYLYIHLQYSNLQSELRTQHWLWG